MLTRWAHALSSKFSVVTLVSAAFCGEGRADSNRSEGYLTTLVPPGVCNGAFVIFGAAFRVPPKGLRLGFVMVSERAAIVAGVGVEGGSSEAMAGSFFRLFGVWESSGTLKGTSSGSLAPRLTAVLLDGFDALSAGYSTY